MAEHSLRRRLMLWLLAPLLGLIVIDSSFLYRVAMRSQQQSFDHALYDSAFDIAQLLRESETPDRFIHFSADMRRMFLSDEYDRMYYAIFDESGRFLGGDPALKRQVPHRVRPGVPFLGSGEINGQPLRVAVAYTAIRTADGPISASVQVAETLTRRERMAREILIGIVVPQLLLLMAAVVIVWFGVGRGLRPLDELNRVVARRQPRDLSPVTLPGMPAEARPLVNSVNLFMSELQHMLQSQNRFIANAAHQLRTPLAGLMAQLELVRAESDPRQQKICYDSIERGLERLAHMVNQLLLLARNQPEVVHLLKTEPLNLDRLAQEVTTEMVPTALQNHVDLGFEAEARDIVIEGERARLVDMLTNLIDNAIRYAGPGSKVTVIARREEGKAVLCVEDNGPGIPEDERDKVFDRFQRVADTAQEGSGLGLAIVREIAKLHDAEVSLRNPATGQGIVFVVTFEPTLLYV
jgi:two-component system sensor histidine kinase TctE